MRGSGGERRDCEGGMRRLASGLGVWRREGDGEGSSERSGGQVGKAGCGLG